MTRPQAAATPRAVIDEHRDRVPSALADGVRDALWSIT